MQNNEQKETSETLALQNSNSRLIREWLAIFGENYRQEVSPALANVWEKGLSTVDESSLRDAFDRALTTCRFFPTLADIYASLENTGLAQLEAERAWIQLQEYIDEWGAERTPLLRNGKFLYPPVLSVATDHAVRTNGGYSCFANATEQNIPFLKKNFIASYLYFSKTKGLIASSREEARKLLNQAAGWGKQLEKP